jgi:hypothetical protein
MPERSSSLDAQSMNTATHVDTGQEQNLTYHREPAHQLRRKKSRIFDNGFMGAFRKIGGNKSPSLSDPEDAPNRPHIVPPLHDSSDPEGSTLRDRNDAEHGLTAVAKRRSAAFRRGEALLDPGSGLSPQEKISEITELMRVRTAAAGVTLQRLAELGDGELDGQGRQGLLAIASAAANVALKEYAWVRRTRPKAPLAGMLERNAEVPFAEVQDYGEYLRCLRWQVRELQDGVRGLGGFREASRGTKDVRKRLDEMSVLLERGGLAADMAEIQWLVERKCMFRAAVDILTADNTHSVEAEFTDD